MHVQNNAQPIIIGCGFVGKYLADILSSQHQQPICIIRSSHSLAALRSLHHDAYVYDLDDANLVFDFDLTGQEIYYFAPPSTTDKCDHRMDSFLSVCKTQPPAKIVYISTSGVYGDCNGAWVDETQALAPISDRATRRVYAERALVNFCQQHETTFVILRVGGIYGPGRLPIQRLSTITVVCPEEAPYSNRIHVSDLANICYLAMQKNCDNEIFNVSDGNATTMTDYYYKLADFAGLPRPPCVAMSEANEELSSGMLSFINESRRLSTKKLHAQLNVTIQFPNLTSGLKDCFSKQS